jgi:Dihydrodipicolinate synthase/N-acetylneuraminate lyase
MNSIPSGAWPTMITPYTESFAVDSGAIKPLVEWYRFGGAAGLFAVCQSSEMFFLSLEERVELASAVVEASGGLSVIASGNTAERLDDQIEEIKRISGTGIDAFVLIANRLAAQGEPDGAWLKAAERILREVPDIPFGIYECPYPYKRLMSPELLAWCASTGRFLFLKDTSCDAAQIGAKLDALRDTGMKLYNAHSGTLLSSLRAGAAGYSGVMANFYPELYAALCSRWREEGFAGRCQDAIGAIALLERQAYPVNAKAFLASQGLPIGLLCRSRDRSDFTAAQALELAQASSVFGPIVRTLASVSGGR